MGGQMSKMMGKIFGSREMRLLMLGLDAAGKTTILYKLKLNQDVTTIPTVGFNVETVTYKNVKFNVWDVGGQDKIRPLWRHYFSGTSLAPLITNSALSIPIPLYSSPSPRSLIPQRSRRSLILNFPPSPPDPAQISYMGPLIFITDPLDGTTGTQGLIFVIDSNDRLRIDEARQELHRIILDREMKDALLLVFANKQDISGGTRSLSPKPPFPSPSFACLSPVPNALCPPTHPTPQKDQKHPS
ncbi:hypothetical protein MMC08_006580 [Hypocenomyce scalaris]|nr:hypothetical protein [Hypocenomyce scalaris]